MVKSIAYLTFGGEFDPEQFQRLVAELGGVRDAHGWDAVLQRGSSVVWIDILPVAPERRNEFVEVERLLGVVPHHQALLHCSSSAESEWLAAEIVVAAAANWNSILRGFDAQPITMAELDKRIERRTRSLFR